MKRLNNLAQIAGEVHLPRYAPEAHGVGIVHLGIGAFHRGHMAVYTDDVLAADGGAWRITGVSLRSAGVRDRLTPQNGLYTLVERSEKGEAYRVIGALRDILVAPEDPEQVLRRLVDSTTRIVSMTITEKGYLRDPASGALMAEHPDVIHDLAHPEQPKTMHGYVVEALARIRQTGRTPFTLLSCDNLPANGSALQRVVVEFAALRDRELADWIAAEVICPNTMVDRIVPATTREDIDQLSRTLGYQDEAPVICEPFSQWVIENSLPKPRPAWEKFGVTFVENVAPYEEMKLRLLNCSHSAMAYLGYLGGFDFIHQVIAEPSYRNFIEGMMREEIVPTLQMPEDVDLQAYCATLIQRFRNTTLGHRTWQIAMDGSLKIPPRILDTLRDRFAQGLSSPRLMLALAGWLRYTTGIDEQGQPIEVSDPFAERLRAIADRHQQDIPDYIDAILAVKEVFGSDLPAQDGFRNQLTTALTTLYQHGARQAVARL